MLEVKLSEETVERVANVALDKAGKLTDLLMQRDREIDRLQRWLGFIAGGFAPPSDSAEQALRGAPPPAGF